MLNVRLSLTKFGEIEQGAERNCLLIADTILVEKDGCQVLTRNVKKALDDISYKLEDEMEVDENEAAVV